MATVKILVVEDSAIIASDIKFKLQDYGYSICDMVESGDAALRSIEQHQPDIVIMDIVIKGKPDGIETGKIIRTRFNKPIIFLTAYSDDETLKRAKLIEPFGYIVKPFEGRELHIAIQMALYKSKIENQLAWNEKKLRQIVEESVDGIVLMNEEGDIIEWSPGQERITGMARSDVMGAKAWEKFSKICPTIGPLSDTYDYFKKTFSVGLKTGTGPWIKEPREYDIIDKNSSKRIIQAVFFPIETEKGFMLGSISRDITKQKQIENALKESELRFRTIFQSVSVGIIVLDADLSIGALNSSFEDMTGFTAQDFANKSIFDLVHPDDLVNYKNGIKKLQAGKETTIELQVRYYSKQKNIIWSKTACSVVKKDLKQVQYIILMIDDITLIKNAEDKLRISQMELRNLSTHLQAVKEEESIRIAREIHDELGQNLTALKMDISWLNIKLAQQDSEIKNKLKSVKTLIDETIKTVQQIAYELRPIILDDLGLVAAIEWQVEELENRTDLKISLLIDSKSIHISQDRAIILFRIFQESMTNILRHSKATKVVIHLYEDNNKIFLEIQDNGIGIETNKIFASDSLGLIGMRERVRSCGGTLDISGKANKGTLVSVTIPKNKS